MILSLPMRAGAQDGPSGVVRPVKPAASCGAVSKKPDRTPVWFMRQAGRYLAEYRKLRERCGMLELLKAPELAAEVTLLPVRKLGVDAAILFSDLLVPLIGFGIPFSYAKGEGPVLPKPIRSEGDVRGLRDFDPEEDLGFVLEAARMVRRELPAEVPLIGFAGAPFTLASYLIEGGKSADYAKTKAFMRSEPAAWGLLMGKLRKAALDLLKAQVRAGADWVQLFDSWAGALTGEEYERHVLPHSRFILEGLKNGDKSPLVIHFGTGTAPFLETFASAGGDVIGVDWRLPLDEAWSRIGRERGIQGNLSPEVLANASRAELKKAVLDILKRAEGRPGHIFNLGHGVLPETPEANVRSVVEWVHT